MAKLARCAPAVPGPRFKLVASISWPGPLENSQTNHQGNTLNTIYFPHFEFIVGVNSERVLSFPAMFQSFVWLLTFVMSEEFDSSLMLISYQRVYYSRYECNNSVARLSGVNLEEMLKLQPQ